MFALSKRDLTLILTQIVLLCWAWHQWTSPYPSNGETTDGSGAFAAPVVEAGRHDKTAADEQAFALAGSGPGYLLFAAVGLLLVTALTARSRVRHPEKEDDTPLSNPCVAAMEASADGLVVVSLPALTIVEVNEALCRMGGYSRDGLLGQHLRTLLGEDVEGLQEALDKGREMHGLDARLRYKEGNTLDIRLNAVTYEEDGLRGFLGLSLSDLTEERQKDVELRLAATFFETTSEAIAITDSNNRITAVNPSFSRITGYGMDEILGKDPALLSSGRHDQAFYQSMWTSLKNVGRWQGEIWNRRKNGELYAEWLSIVSVKGADGEILHHVAVFSDITKRKRDEETIWQQANVDALTSLPNRTLFLDRLTQALQTARREAWQTGLMFVDLDRFKLVNETMGHQQGDELLQQAARRLVQCVREGDTVARLGGDEFGIILPDLKQSHEAQTVAERILSSLSAPFTIGGNDSYITGSIGITLYPGDGRTTEELLRNADSAMYRAKESGRNAYCYYTQEVNDEARRRLRLEGDLRRALERDELEVHYQPVMNMAGTVAGAEALLRWQHPEFGLLPPIQFIPLAEETGLIMPLERWVMRQACRQIAKWRHAFDLDLFVAVNITSLQCTSTQCSSTLSEVLRETALPPSRLKLEITERVMMENTEEVIHLLQHVRNLGVQLAVDDFGTGYSSLSYLKRLPVDLIKIDREFIRELPHDAGDVALVEAIVAMSRSLRLGIVAEGVETLEQLEFLRRAEVDMVQGFCFSKPLPPAMFEDWLRGQNQEAKRA